MGNNLKLAEIFNDHMVLQRGVEVPIWGSAASKSLITVEFLGVKRITETVNGKWSVKLPPMEAGGPYKMRISDGKNEIVLNDILIGEVWIAGGQSNMQFPLSDSKDADTEIPFADFPLIRYYDVPKMIYETEPLECPEKYSERPEWKICTPQNAGKFSAVAYYFAKDLQKALGVPIGIIGCNYGATSASHWMNEKYLSQDPDVKSYLDEYNEIIACLDPEEYKSRFKKLEMMWEQVQSYNKKLDRIDLIEDINLQRTIIAEVWDFLDKLPSIVGPKYPISGCYYNMLRKIIPYAVKGVIFYQGESDDHKPRIYSKLFSKMIQNWRDDWGNKQMPFLFVQLPSFGCIGSPDGELWALMREQQSIVEKTVPNTAMAISIDCGEENNPHPRNKKPIGERLALLARAKVYGEDIECSGPVYRKMKIDKNKVILSFDHIGKGFIAKGGPLKGFKICTGRTCGREKKFVDAKAEIKGDIIEVYSDEVTVPFAVRYAWANYPEANLYNKDGLPAAPFRTDIYS